MLHHIYRTMRKHSLYIHSTFWSCSFLSSPTAHFLCCFLQYAVKTSSGDLRVVIMLTVQGVCINVWVCVCVCVCVLGVNSLCQSLSANPSIPGSLVHLDLSGNVLRGDDMQVRQACAHSLTHTHTHTHTRVRTHTKVLIYLRVSVNKT